MKIGFLGGGQIARALAAGFRAAGAVEAGDLSVADRLPEASRAFAERLGATVFADAAALAASNDVVFLCVKPRDAAEALSGGVGERLEGKLLVSVAAGLTLEFLSDQAGSGCFVCRAMPNTAAEIRQSATAICFSDNTPAALRETARGLFGAVGEVFELPERLFDAFVGVAGSGPAYACLLMEAMSDGAVRTGIGRETANRLAALAVRGAASLVLETGVPPATLRHKISSPAGTTLAALRVMERRGIRSHVSSAVEAAAARSKQLSRG